MDFLPREQVIEEMTETLHKMMEVYQLEDVGVFEEEGEGDVYYVGYTVRRKGDVFMMHMPFIKNDAGELAPRKIEWTVETEEEDFHGYQSLDDVFTAISNGQIH